MPSLVANSPSGIPRASRRALIVAPTRTFSSSSVGVRGGVLGMFWTVGNYWEHVKPEPGNIGNFPEHAGQDGDKFVVTAAYSCALGRRRALQQVDVPLCFSEPVRHDEDPGRPRWSETCAPPQQPSRQRP